MSDEAFADAGQDEQRMHEASALSRAHADMASTERSRPGSLCEECGEPIQAARLEVKPYTRFCVECLNLIEQQSRHQRIG